MVILMCKIFYMSNQVSVAFRDYLVNLNLATKDIIAVKINRN